MPMVHARDAMDAKVAAIGKVNPRPGGFVNSVAQGFKKLIARALDWHVREQVEFNRAAAESTQAAIDALSEVNRAMTQLAAHFEHEIAVTRADARHMENVMRAEFLRIDAAVRETRAVQQELGDIRRHWQEWRAGYEERQNSGEIHILRTLGELQTAFQLRVTLLEQNFRDLTAKQHTEFTHTLEENTIEVQKRLWADLEKVRAEYERMIHAELRLVRQRAAAPPSPASAPVATGHLAIDWLKFAERFRGSQEEIARRQKIYVDRFRGASNVLDLGCGRGEMLAALKEAGISARGIEANAELVALGREAGLDIEKADLFAFLENATDGSLGGVYCSQVIEHLQPAQLAELIPLLARKAKSGALVAFETPNPECLAIFATHFYIDPTHTRPVPPALLAFYLEEAGFGRIEIERLHPAWEDMPSLLELPEAVRLQFFGGLDYAAFAVKL
jgi:O-antigen chain-terminating methyltransferase